jgi:hypothetical protein
MRKSMTNRLAAAVLAAALSLPVAGWAASADTPAATGSAATAMPAAGSQQQKVEQRIADMHATLKITSSEEPQWDKFSQVMLDNAQTMDSLLSANAGKVQTQTAAEMMQTYAMIAQQHAQDVQKLSTAFDTLYASLTPEQKKSADDMFRSSVTQREQKTGG